MTGHTTIDTIVNDATPAGTPVIPADIAEALVDPLAYADGDRLDAAFDHLRRTIPFGVARPEGFDAFRVATRHADILDIERQAGVFLNGAGSSNALARDAIAFSRMVTGEPNLIRSLVAVDGEEHRALRALTFPALTPKAIRALEGDIRAIAKRFVDAMLDKGTECDFARDLAFWYPLRVVMALLGVPEEDEGYLLTLTQQLFGANDPELNRTGTEAKGLESMTALAQVAADLEAYFGAVTTRLRESPDGSINSLIANARIDGDYLTHRQLMGYYIIAATAGHDTTANTTAAGMWALAERPEVLAALQADPALMPAFVEETIRWATPVKNFMRTAIDDATVNGQPVRKGEWIMLAYHSANRDEAVFDAPHAFRLDRPLHKHVAFGSGPHVCLGQHLARFEMRALWEELLPRLGSIELTGTPTRMASTFVVGPKSVPIRYTVR